MQISSRRLPWSPRVSSCAFCRLHPIKEKRYLAGYSIPESIGRYRMHYMNVRKSVMENCWITANSVKCNYLACGRFIRKMRYPCNSQNMTYSPLWMSWNNSDRQEKMKRVWLVSRWKRIQNAESRSEKNVCGENISMNCSGIWNRWGQRRRSWRLTARSMSRKAISWSLVRRLHWYTRKRIGQTAAENYWKRAMDVWHSMKRHFQEHVRHWLNGKSSRSLVKRRSRNRSRSYRRRLQHWKKPCPSMNRHKNITELRYDKSKRQDRFKTSLPNNSRRWKNYRSSFCRCMKRQCWHCICMNRLMTVLLHNRLESWQHSWKREAPVLYVVPLRTLIRHPYLIPL